MVMITMRMRMSRTGMIQKKKKMTKMMKMTKMTRMTRMTKRRKTTAMVQIAQEIQ
ncbi:hypothetical protein BOH78_3128 [Pichia kudriavzevii]|uniref:Uncharacterized protein n=1 Tax=Pichia kudriavzevii TaxID=4909 RepID=A0A1V2LNK6_PICKU|nr:hypothetical protein BOH78_3128 [Pichia kudriavzevii]